MPADIWARWLDDADREDAAADRMSRMVRSQVRDRVLEKAGLRRGSHLVDLGCGNGFLSLQAARMLGPEGRVTAVDSSPGALQALRERAGELGLENILTLKAEITRLPLPDGDADAVVARSVLSYVPDRMAVLAEARRVLKPGGSLSLFEPVLAEEELTMDWGEDFLLWRKLRGILEAHHPAFGFDRLRVLDEVGAAGFEAVDSFVWHSDVTRTFADAEEAMEDFRNGLPGEFSLLSCWLAHGVVEEEIGRVASRLAAESRKRSYRSILPCLYVWAGNPENG